MIYLLINGTLICDNARFGITFTSDFSKLTSKDYPIFRKLISFYEKEKRYDEAIKLCDIAVNYGIVKYLGKITMAEKKEKLKEKIK